METEEEVRIGQHTFQRELNTVVEGSSLFASGVEEFKKRFEVGLGRRTAVGETRHLRENRRGAGAFLGQCLWIAGEDGLPAGRIFGDSTGLIRTTDLNGADV